MIDKCANPHRGRRKSLEEWLSLDHEREVYPEQKADASQHLNRVRRRKGHMSVAGQSISGRAQASLRPIRCGAQRLRGSVG